MAVYIDGAPIDGDQVLEDLRQRFDEVLATLESAAGWQTERVQRPVLILGRLEGVLTGIRQLRRTHPLATGVINGLRVPTLAEMARIKAWLLATRYTVRDGEISAWRELYRLSQTDAALRTRIARIVLTVPFAGRETFQPATASDRGA